MILHFWDLAKNLCFIMKLGQMIDILHSKLYMTRGLVGTGFRGSTEAIDF